MERAHCTLKDRLRCAGGNCFDKLQEVVFYINATGSEGEPTPFEAFYAATTSLPAEWPTKSSSDSPSFLRCPRFICPRVNLPVNTLSPRFGTRISVQRRISPQLVQADEKVFHLKNCRIIW